MRYLLLLSCLMVGNAYGMIALPEDKTEWFRLFNSTEKQVLFEKIKWHKTEKLFDTDYPRSASKQVILTDLEVPHEIITIDGLLRRPPALQVKRTKTMPNNALSRQSKYSVLTKWTLISLANSTAVGLILLTKLLNQECETSE